jgi:hypothetical protein
MLDRRAHPFDQRTVDRAADGHLPCDPAHLVEA